MRGFILEGGGFGGSASGVLRQPAIGFQVNVTVDIGKKL